MTLRNKFFLALFLCSVAALAVVGGVVLRQIETMAAGAALREALLTGLGGGLLVALVLGRLLGTALARPLQEMAATLQERTPGLPPPQLADDAGGEAGMLAAAFNRLRLELAQGQAALAEATARVQAQATELRELSTRDALTGLHDSRYFDTHAATMFNLALRHGQHFAVVLADIDFFKRINDSHSHALGDAVLRQVATLLQANVRHTDLLARYGGEEFVIAFPQTSQEQAQQLCEKLRGVIEAWPWFDLHPALHVTISMGVAINYGHGSVEDMLRAADAQLHRAKVGGRNQVCVPA
jgi:diguanylate cyclase (GGDEF)-like protein